MAKKAVGDTSALQMRAEALAKQYGVKKVWVSEDGAYWATSESARDATLKGKKFQEFTFE